MLDQLLATPGVRERSCWARRSGSSRCTAGSRPALRRSRKRPRSRRTHRSTRSCNPKTCGGTSRRTRTSLHSRTRSSLSRAGRARRVGARIRRPARRRRPLDHRLTRRFQPRAHGAARAAAPRRASGLPVDRRPRSNPVALARRASRQPREHATGWRCAARAPAARCARPRATAPPWSVPSPQSPPADEMHALRRVGQPAKPSRTSCI